MKCAVRLKFEFFSIVGVFTKCAEAITGDTIKVGAKIDIITTGIIILIPKLILSTSNAYIHMQECLKNGATEYFVKPNSMRELEEMTDKMLELYA